MDFVLKVYKMFAGEFVKRLFLLFSCVASNVMLSLGAVCIVRRCVLNAIRPFSFVGLEAVTNIH